MHPFRLRERVIKERKREASYITINPDEQEKCLADYVLARKQENNL